MCPYDIRSSILNNGELCRFFFCHLIFVYRIYCDNARATLISSQLWVIIMKLLGGKKLF